MIVYVQRHAWRRMSVWMIACLFVLTPSLLSLSRSALRQKDIMALTNPMNTMPMGPWKITVYDQEYFQGKRMEFTACCQNIMECGMENIRSLKVECGA